MTKYISWLAVRCEMKRKYLEGILADSDREIPQNWTRPRTVFYSKDNDLKLAPPIRVINPHLFHCLHS